MATLPAVARPSTRSPVRRKLPDLPVSPVALVHVRRGENTDLDELVALEQRTFDSDRLSRAQYRRHLDSESAQVLVASASRNHFLGAAVIFFRQHSQLARLYSLATLPQARGHGVGGALLEAAEHAAQRRGCRAMRLEVQVGNARAIGLYERHGYVRFARYERYYEDGANAWRYEKLLK